MAYSSSVRLQIITYKATARRRAVEPCALVRGWGSRRQAEFAAGSGPLTVPGCTHGGQTHTQHSPWEVLCELRFERSCGASAAVALAVSLERTLIKTERKMFSGEIYKWYKTWWNSKWMQRLRAVPAQRACAGPLGSSWTETMDTVLKWGYKKTWNFCSRWHSAF